MFFGSDFASFVGFHAFNCNSIAVFVYFISTKLIIFINVYMFICVFRCVIINVWMFYMLSLVTAICCMCLQVISVFSLCLASDI